MSKLTTRKSRGFSLLEVLIVILILGVLVGAATFLRPEDLRRSRLDSVTEEVWQALFLAQSRSRSGYANTLSGVHFDESSYTIFSDTPYDANEPTNLVYDLPDNISLDSSFIFSTDEVYFSVYYGYPADANNSFVNPGVITISTGGLDSTITVGADGVISVN